MRLQISHGAISIDRQTDRPTDFTEVSRLRKWGETGTAREKKTPQKKWAECGISVERELNHVMKIQEIAKFLRRVML